MSKQITGVQLALNMLKSGTSVSTARAFAKRQGVKTEFNRILRERMKSKAGVHYLEALSEVSTKGTLELEACRRNSEYLKTHRRVWRKLLRGLRTRKLFINSLEEATTMKRILDGGIALRSTVSGEAWGWAEARVAKILKNPERLVNRSMKKALVGATREEFALTKVSLTQGININSLTTEPKASNNEVANMRKERKAIEARLKAKVRAIVADVKAFGRWLDVTLLSPLTCHLLAARKGIRLTAQALNHLAVEDMDWQEHTPYVCLRDRAKAYTC